jgi:hypothetical protein
LELYQNSAIHKIGIARILEKARSISIHDVELYSWVIFYAFVFCCFLVRFFQFRIKKQK